MKNSFLQEKINQQKRPSAKRNNSILIKTNAYKIICTGFDLTQVQCFGNLKTIQGCFGIFGEDIVKVIEEDTAGETVFGEHEYFLPL